jgi:hypothetical protein
MLQRCWIAAVLFLVAAGSRVHGQTQLEWKFKDGDKFYLETVSSFKQGMKSLGKELRQDFEMTFLFSRRSWKESSCGQPRRRPPRSPRRTSSTSSSAA